MREVYLDNCATTRPLPEVIDAINEVLNENYGNPSSLHNKGLEAERIIKNTRKALANKLNVKQEEIYFTSGGTESNNLAIKGIAYQYQNRGKHLITTEIEHAAVLEPMLALEQEGFEVTFLQTDKYGNISLDNLKETIRQDTILVSIFHVNNELGTIQPLSDIGQIIKNQNKNTFFHTDCVQTPGKIYLQPAKWNIDLLTISGHKFHGPKGIGALYLKKGVELKPQLLGGGQENGIRSGTENMPGIAGLLPAINALPDLSSESPRNQKLDKLRNYFSRKIKKVYPSVIINSPKNGAPHILNISFPGIKAEVLIHALENKGVYISTGSACHSRNEKKSHVLRAIGLPAKQIDGTVRISFSGLNTKKEVDYAVDIIIELIGMYF